MPTRLRSRSTAFVIAASTAVALAGVVTAGQAHADPGTPIYGPQVNIGSGFAQPMGVAVNSAGDVYVADGPTNKVWRVPADGGQMTTIGSGFQFPTAVAVDAQDTVYVADYNNSRIERIASDGVQTTLTSNQVSAPSGIAVGPDGMVYVANTGGHDVFKIDGSGAGGQTTIASGITLPTGVAVAPDGTVYVADASSSGNSILQVGTSGPTSVLPIPGLQNPYAVALDSDGNVYVANSGVNNVLRYGTDGSTIAVGSSYNTPLGVTVDSVGDVIVADTYTPRVTVNPRAEAQTITLNNPLPNLARPGTSASLAATGGGSGNPVTFAIDSDTYPSDACVVGPLGKRIRFVHVGFCVLDFAQEGSLHYLAAHRQVTITIRPAGMVSLHVTAPTTNVPAGESFSVAAHALDASGNDLGDVTPITTFTLTKGGSCGLDSCTPAVAGNAKVSAHAVQSRGSATIVVVLSAGVVNNGEVVTTVESSVGTDLDGIFVFAVGAPSGSITYTVTSGGYPPGVTLDDQGVFRGAPTQAGTYPFVLRIVDQSHPAKSAVVRATFHVVSG